MVVDSRLRHPNVVYRLFVGPNRANISVFEVMSSCAFIFSSLLFPRTPFSLLLLRYPSA